MKTLIGSCTKHTKDTFLQTPMYKSMLCGIRREWTDGHGIFTGKYDAIIKLNNSEPLWMHYNKVIEMAIDQRYDTVILLHDDVSIEDINLTGKLTDAFQDNDVVGLAGAKQASISKPALWHLMSKQEDWSGAVAHKSPDDTVFMTSFGSMPARCVLLDGVFLAINVKSLKDGVRFDENLKFHHYDLDWCLTCNENKLKLTTWPIWAVHDSGGLSDMSQEFIDSEKYFLDKWQKN